MSGLLSLLLFAAFFYFMMRFGCGAHMVHGHGGHEGHAGPASGTGERVDSSTAKDPVCGMEVQPGEGYAKMHQGRQYRFCSKKCLDQFEVEPQRYAQGKGGMS
jgi:YHS domain-containing protein